MFNYLEIATDARIQSYIRKFWVVDNLCNSLFSDTLYALPNGSFTLAFISGQGAIVETEAGQIDLNEGVYFVGQITQRVKLCIKPFSKAVMAQLSPCAAPLFTTCPQHQLTNQVIELKQIDKKSHNLLQYLHIADDAQLVNVISAQVENNLPEARDAGLIQNIFNQFNNSTNHSALRMAGLAAHTGFSKRYIEKKFQQHVGLSPKEAYTIMKIRRLIDELEARKSLTQLALNYGYYDQSHFIKSYAAIMESSPAKFKKSDYILPF